MNISKHILIIGGYGKAGTSIAELLIRHSNHAITLAGRDPSKAQKTAERLNRKYQSKQTYGIKLDLTNIGNLQKILSLYDVLIVCFPFPENSSKIVETIAEADIHYIDIAPNKSKNHLFQSQQHKLICNEKVCLLEAGWEPGLPALLVRLANEKLNGRTKEVNIHAVYRDREMPAGSIADIIEHASFEQQIFEDNRWEKTSMLNTTAMSLPEPWGSMMGFPTELSELQELPEKLSLESLKLYQGGHNWLSDLVLFLLTIFGSKKGSFVFNQGIKFFRWANQKFTTPASAGIIKVIASNEDQSVTITAMNKDLYQATAIPVVASVLLMDQGVVTPGVGFMGHKLPPQQMEALLAKMGISIKTSTKRVEVDETR